jgi:uncharacterized cupin superfamily protein
MGRDWSLHRWSGSGPGYLHVHHQDDEAWHVLSGSLTFRLTEGEKVAGPGTTVVIPAGTVHDYFETDGPCEYLILLTPRLEALITELHQTPWADHGAVHARHASEVVVQP